MWTAIAAAIAAFATSPAAVGQPLETALLDPVTFSSPAGQLALRHTATGAGAKYVRLQAIWRIVAPAQRAPGFDAANPDDPQYDWFPLDDQVTAAVDAGLEPIVYVENAPQWATYADSTAGGLRRARARDLARFLTAAAQRYDGTQGLPQVRFWQIWNEPNHAGQRPLLAGAADWYRGFVNAAAAALHGVDPSNVVVAGGLSPFGMTTSSPPLAFMRRLLCLSPGPAPKVTCSTRVHFDVWSTHPYSAGAPSKQARGPDDVSIGDLPEMRKLLDAGVATGQIVSDEPIRFWITELSWDSSPPDPLGVPLATHARFVSEALYRAWSAGVSLVTWFRLRDDPLGVTAYQCGLYFRGNSVAFDRPKPALRAFRFPFVALPEGERVRVWGRTRAGQPVDVEQFAAGAWRRIVRLRADRNGVFTTLVKPFGTGAIRAWTDKDVSVPFALKPPPDRPYRLFGS